jgi:hypothetical protein
VTYKYLYRTPTEFGVPRSTPDVKETDHPRTQSTRVTISYNKVPADASLWDEEHRKGKRLYRIRCTVVHGKMHRVMELEIRIAVARDLGAANFLGE